LAVPALIAVGATARRAFGEVHHWPEPLVNSAVCDEAILGVNWLMPIFGVYSELGCTPKMVAAS
jgi:hypothetical protein